MDLFLILLVCNEFTDSFPERDFLKSIIAFRLEKDLLINFDALSLQYKF
jgi:hypothetical protein